MPDKTPFGPQEFAALTGVSRETLARMKAYAGLLEGWNSRHNLVSKSSLADVWRRHFWDSAQLLPMIPARAESLVDLGSGAGFPGLVLAELLRKREMRLVLYEATAKKCQFLETVAGHLALKIEIRHVRIEESPPEPFDVITARACAPLDILLPYAQRFWNKGAVALFLKGQSIEVELTKARKSWRIAVERYPSQSDPSGVILQVRELQRAFASHRPSR